jgi:FixJ family two-component response regulator
MSREIILTTGARRLFSLRRRGRSWLYLPVHAADADLRRIMATAESIVFVIDDDPSFRRSIEMLIESSGLRVQTFSSAEEFLRSRRPDAPACLLLDVRLPHLSGLDLQRELTKAGVQIPIIFITGHGDIPMTVQAMKAGAIEFLTKPFREQDLLDGIRRAINFDRATRLQRDKLADLHGRYQTLTAREREVIARVVTGMLNKQIADALGITEKTVKVHRGHIMQKMGARSLAELVRTAERLGIFGQTA